MTMPHLMNCDHSCEGWCLSCVKSLHQESRLPEVLAKLREWESRKDHDVGPGLHVIQGWLQMFADGSGNIVLELSTDCVDELGVYLGRLLTNIGAAGTVQRNFPFVTLDDAYSILSEPIKVKYDG